MLPLREHEHCLGKKTFTDSDQHPEAKYMEVLKKRSVSSVLREKAAVVVVVTAGRT